MKCRYRILTISWNFVLVFALTVHDLSKPSKPLLPFHKVPRPPLRKLQGHCGTLSALHIIQDATPTIMLASQSLALYASTASHASGTRH